LQVTRLRSAWRAASLGGALKQPMEGVLPKVQATTTEARINSITGVREVTTSSSAQSSHSSHSAQSSVTSVSADPAPLTPLRDAYEFNQSFNWVDPSYAALPRHILDMDMLRGKPVLEHGLNVEGTVRWQLDAGVQQDVSDGIITYTFATWNHGVGVSNSPKFGQGQGYSPFTPEQQDAGRIAIQNWDDLISAKFVEVPAGPGASVYGKNSADIVLANTYTGPAQAEAYYPGLTPYYGPTYARVQGDVWIADPRVNSSNLEFLPGQYGLQTLNHELGHTLGLTHPGAYNFGDDNDGDGQPDPINYTGDAFYFQDSHQYTIMSYFDAYETGGSSIDWNIMRFIYPSTPMVDDVFVIQQKYGADLLTRADDTTYGWNATPDLTNEAMIFRDGEIMSAFTIWDGGGNDTLDLSGYYTDSVIDLREGAYSSAGGWGAYSASTEALDLAAMDPLAALAIIDANNADAGLGPRTQTGDAAELRGADYIYQLYINGEVPARDANGDPIVDDDGNPVYLNEGLSWAEITGAESNFVMENNMGIAYGAVIENAVGGHGNDRINGNYVDNSFTGGEGDDTFIIANHTMVLPALDGTTRTVTDHSTDTITDFGNGDDVLDLTSFGDLAVSDVSWNDATDILRIDTNHDGNYDVNVVIHGTFTTGDILFG
jgi:serralysin